MASTSLHMQSTRRRILEYLQRNGRATVKELGGEVKSLEDSDENVAEFGRFALCKDDQGSSFGLHQPPP